MQPFKETLLIVGGYSSPATSEETAGVIRENREQSGARIRAAG